MASGGNAVAGSRPVSASRTAAEPGPAPSSTRTRSIWLAQLVLGATTVAIVLLVLVVQPGLFSTWPFPAGVALVLALTVLTLAVPWHRIGPGGTLLVPFGDIVAIGLLNADTDTDMTLAFLWAFPIVWIANHFAAVWLASALVLIGMTLIVLATPAVMSGDILRSGVVLVALSFIGITLHMGARRTRAFQQLLRRQTTRLQTTLERAQMQERRTTEVLAGLDVGVARVARGGEILGANAAYGRLYGGPADEPGMTEHLSFPGPAVTDDQRVFARAARGETFANETRWMLDAHGRRHAVIASSTPLSWTPEEGSSTLLVISDVTALLTAQRDREEVTTLATHELRNPLTIVLGRAELALGRSDLPGGARADLQIIHDASERMLAVASEFLHSSRSAAARPRIARAVDVGIVVRESIESFEPGAQAAGVALVDETAAHLPAFADALRLRQVVDNLIGNAVKYTPAGGTITISSGSTRERITVTVADTGIGIASDDLARVFAPYFRTELAEAIAEGTGLGLGISRDIVEGWGGTLAIAQGASGEGTVVTVTLPVRSEA